MLQNVYESNNRGSKQMKQKLSELNEEMHKFTITVDLNTLVSATDRTI